MKQKYFHPRITELEREKETLSEQVKRLIKAEGRLYRYQEELDIQLKEYKDLYELNRKLNTTFGTEKIYEYTLAYVTHNLEFERAVLFLKEENTRGYIVSVLDGYYDKEEKNLIAQQVIAQDAPLLSPLLEGREYLICGADAEESELTNYRPKFGMNEYFICPLGTPSLPQAVLVFGNSAENARFYHRVIDSPGTLLSVGNLVGLVSSSIEKNVYYQKMETALGQERLAEAKYRGIFENAVEGIFQTTPSGQILAANPAIARMLGYASPRELLANVTDINRQLYVEPERRSEIQRLLEERGTVVGFDTRFYRKDGSVIWVSISARIVRNETGQVLYYEGTTEDITVRKRAEEEHLSYVRFLESLERVDRSIRQAESLEGMMTDVLDTVLSIFEADRAWLLYPCDPSVPSWRVPMERTREEYPGALAMNIDVPMTPAIAGRFREALSSAVPVVDEPFSGHPVPQEISEQFYVRSQIMTAVYPKMGKPWLFGVHQCSYARVWHDKDRRLITEISRRIADGLSSLLFLKDLKESESRFRALVDNLPVKVFVKNRQSVYIACNPNYARDLGIRPEEIIGRTDYDFHPANLAEKYRADDRRIMESGRVEELEEEYTTNGRHNWVLSIKTPLRDPARNITGILGVFWDITKRKRAEEAVKESRERFRNLVETTSDWVWEVDENAVYTYASPKVRDILGYEPEEVLGRIPFDLMRPDEARRVGDIFRDIAASRKPFSFLENINLHKEGRQVVLETSGVPFFDADGNFRGYRGIDRDITARKRAEETIRYQAYHDLLTGLPNRAMFMDRLSHEIPEMQRIQKRLAVLFLDVDHFKNINDTLGHSAGDALIKEIAVRLKKGMHEFDTVARIGGDEFTILLPLITRPEDASRAAGKVMGAFKQPFVIDAHELHVSASIGISLCPDDGDNAESLLKNSDIALHYAKDQGRNNYQYFNPDINVRTIERIILENRLRQALERRELEVYYQPIIALADRRIVCAEALVRWNHPELGLLNPMQFIPVAEDIGLMQSIDEWVLRTACAQNKAWQDAGYSSICVTVNLSARQFQLPNLAEIIFDALQGRNVCPESLGIEITETLAMKDTKLTSRNLDQLNTMGIRLSIDDFGTGYSSLSYLKKLPIHKLKIDKSFIAGLASDPDYQAIINAVIAMAHSLKLKVLAEGVETEDQMSFLDSRDCDEIQGFYFSKPVPPEEFEKLLAVNNTLSRS